MPTYSYECPDGHKHEEFEPITAPAKRPCPVCGKIMQRLITGGGGVLWKGGSPTPRFGGQPRRR